MRRFDEFPNVELLGCDPAALTGEEQAVLRQLARYCQAMTEADTATLRELVDEGYILVHMSGRRQTREQYFADIERGALRYFTIGIQNLRITVEGERALVSLTSVLNASAYGARGVYHMPWTHHWERRDGVWRLSQ